MYRLVIVTVRYKQQRSCKLVKGWVGRGGKTRVDRAVLDEMTSHIPRGATYSYC